MGFDLSDKSTVEAALDDDSSSPGPVKTQPMTLTAVLSEDDLHRDLRNDPEARIAFLATFTSEEEKSIMNKIDRRFLILIGIMFMFKNVSWLLVLKDITRPKANMCRRLDCL